MCNLINICANSNKLPFRISKIRSPNSYGCHIVSMYQLTNVCAFTFFLICSADILLQQTIRIRIKTV